MINFRFIFIWIAAFAIIHNFVRISYPVIEDKVLYYRWSLLWAVVLFFPLFWIASRGPILGDVGTYLGTFDRLPSTWSGLKEYLSGIEFSGISFRVFEGLLKVLFGKDRIIFRTGVALVQAVPLIFVFRRYSENYLFSVYLFVAAGCFNSWMMNGLRQFIAAALIFSAMPLLIKKRYLGLLMVILFAATIHTSALVMVPIVFIVQGKAWNGRTILYIVLAVVAAYLFSTREELFDMMLTGTEYAGTMEWATAGGDDGMNPIRVLVLSMPMILAFFCRNRIAATGDPVVNINVNMSIVTAGISLIAMVTSGVMTGRLPIYTELYSYILLPYILNHGFDESSRKLMVMLTVVLYFFYFLYGYGWLLF